MKISRRLALAGAAATLPRVAIAQADTRRSVTVAVQKITNTGVLEPLREQSSNVSERWVASILETPIARNQQSKLERVPGIAESWKRLSPTTVELKLRRNATFHNGDRLTAEDVAFSYGPHMFGANLPADIPKIAERHFPALQDVEIIDDHTVHIVNSLPDLTLEGRLSAGGREIVSKRHWLATGDWAANAKSPCGTGPYRLKNFRADSELLLESHDTYWAGRPPLKSVRFVEVPEVASRIAGLRAGEFDFACDIPPDQIAEVEKDSRLAVQGGLVTNHRIVVFDKNHPILANPKIRLAMAHAVDCQAIVDALWGGRARVPAGLQFDFYGDMFVSGWSVPKYDPALARTLLKEANYQGGEIIYRARNNYYTAEIATAQILVEFWKQIGLNIRLEVKENWPQVLDKSGPRGVRDWSNSAVFDDPVSSLVNQHGPNGAQQTNGEWTNTEMNTLSAELESGTDQAARKKTFARMLEITEREDPAYIVLHQNAVFTGLKKNLPWKQPPSFFMDFFGAWKA